MFAYRTVGIQLINVYIQPMDTRPQNLRYDDPLVLPRSTPNLHSNEAVNYRLFRVGPIIKMRCGWLHTPYHVSKFDLVLSITFTSCFMQLQAIRLWQLFPSSKSIP